MTVVLPKILVAGVGPIPPERPDRLFAPGLRIWGIARELARAGHPVRLICARFGDAWGGGESEARVWDLGNSGQPGELQKRIVPEGDWGKLLSALAAEFGAEAAVGSTDFMNHGLSRAGLSI